LKCTLSVVLSSTSFAPMTFLVPLKCSIATSLSPTASGAIQRCRRRGDRSGRGAASVVLPSEPLRHFEGIQGAPQLVWSEPSSVTRSSTWIHMNRKLEMNCELELVLWWLWGYGQGVNVTLRIKECTAQSTQHHAASILASTPVSKHGRKDTSTLPRFAPLFLFISDSDEPSSLRAGGSPP
jgi:hypothetical protein